MFTKSIFKVNGLMALVALLLPLLLSCTASEKDIGEIDDNEPIRFLVADDEEWGTRGAYETAKQFTSYAIYTFNRTAKRPYVGNVTMAKQSDGTWTASRTIPFPGKNALDLYALKPGFARDDVKNLTMTWDEQSFVHTLPNANYKQTDFMISSLLDKTKEETGGTLMFKFKHLFSYLRFVGKTSLENVNVKVHSLTIHNIKSTGKFTFSNTVERDGSWELQEDLDNYTFLMPADRDLTNKNAVIHTTDSMLFVMSQIPKVFTISNNTSFADADTNGEAYLEIECRIWKMEDDGVTPRYIGCSDTSWAKVYYPLSATTRWQTNASPYSATYNLMFDFTGGYTYEGEDFLKKYTNGEMKMISIEPVKSFLVTNPWEDDDYNSQTLEMK